MWDAYALAIARYEAFQLTRPRDRRRHHAERLEDQIMEEVAELAARRCGLRMGKNHVAEVGVLGRLTADLLIANRSEQIVGRIGGVRIVELLTWVEFAESLDEIGRKPRKTRAVRRQLAQRDRSIATRVEDVG